MAYVPGLCSNSQKTHTHTTQRWWTMNFLVFIDLKWWTLDYPRPPILRFHLLVGTWPAALLNMGDFNWVVVNSLWQCLCPLRWGFATPQRVLLLQHEDTLYWHILPTFTRISSALNFPLGYQRSTCLTRHVFGNGVGRETWTVCLCFLCLKGIRVCDVDKYIQTAVGRPEATHFSILFSIGLRYNDFVKDRKKHSAAPFGNSGI